MTRDDVEILELPYQDDWYDKPEMLVPIENPAELAVAFMKGMIKVGRWSNEHKHAASAILDKQTSCLDAEDTYRGIKEIDMVPNLSP